MRKAVGAEATGGTEDGIGLDFGVFSMPVVFVESRGMLTGREAEVSSVKVCVSSLRRASMSEGGGEGGVGAGDESASSSSKIKSDN